MTRRQLEYEARQIRAAMEEQLGTCQDMEKRAQVRADAESYLQNVTYAVYWRRFCTFSGACGTDTADWKRHAEDTDALADAVDWLRGNGLFCLSLPVMTHSSVQHIKQFVLFMKADMPRVCVCLCMWWIWIWLDVSVFLPSVAVILPSDLQSYVGHEAAFKQLCSYSPSEPFCL